MVKTMVAIAALAVLSASPARVRASGNDRDVVIEWNQILQNTMPATAGLQSPRYYSMLHIAMFDAANSIERGYNPYRIRVRAPFGRSSEAAAAQAAHDVLATLFPANVAVYDAALVARLQGIPKGFAEEGAKVGKSIAEAILAWRQNDGWSAVPPAYVLPPLAGLWQPTPPPNAPASFTQFPKVTPFATLSATQFLHDLPPTLTSDRYTTDFNEVKTIGAVNSATRTDEQTLLARLFAGVVTPTNLFQMWNNVARDTANDRGLSLLDTARLFALMNVSINDGLQTSHAGKFIYSYWRPVTAIRRAGEDLNPGTEADAAWLPLLTTPSYPSYPGNMACVGASAATALALAFEANDVPFTVIWRNASGPDYQRSYAGFWQLAVDQANSRVYGGIHYRFDNESSQVACPKVATFIVDNYMRPR